MATFNVPNTIETGSEIVSAEHEQNYQAIQADLNTEVIRRDGSVAMTGQLALVGAPVGALSATTKDYVDTLFSGGDAPVAFPAGIAYPFFSDVAPSGWAFCQGQTITRASAPLLATEIASGPGVPFWVDSTNFKLPDLRDRVPAGKGTSLTTLGQTIGQKDSVVVSHSHSYTDTYRSVSTAVASGSSYGYSPNLQYDYPSTASAGQSGTNMNYQPTLVCNWIMRLA